MTCGECHCGKIKIVCCDGIYEPVYVEFIQCPFDDKKCYHDTDDECTHIEHFKKINK